MQDEKMREMVERDVAEVLAPFYKALKKNEPNRLLQAMVDVVNHAISRSFHHVAECDACSGNLSRVNTMMITLFAAAAKTYVGRGNDPRLRCSELVAALREEEQRVIEEAQVELVEVGAGVEKLAASIESAIMEAAGVKKN